MHSFFSRAARIAPLLLLGLFLVSACGQNQGNDDAESSDDIPYTVGEALSDSTVALIVSSNYGTDTLATDQYERQVSFAMQGIPPNQRSGDRMKEAHQQIVRQFAARHVIQGKAKESGTEVDTAQVTQQLESIKGRYESEDAFMEELEGNNVTVDSLRRFIAARLREQAVQQEMANSAGEPTESEIQSYSQENRRIRAQHILLKVNEDAPEPQVDSVRGVAEALIDSAMGGVAFADLARRHSEGPSASRGGDLGFFARGQMVEPFSDAAFALSDSGDVAAEPVRTRFGFHVIRLTNAGQPMDTSRARQQMMQERRRDAFDEELNKLLADATIRANPDVVTAGLYEEEASSETSAGNDQ